MTSIIDQAHEAIPGYTEAARAVDTSRRWVTEGTVHTNTVEIARTVHQQLMTAAQAGKAIPEATVDELLDADRTIANATRRNDLLRETYEAARQQLAEVVKAGVGDGLAFLEAALTDLYATVNDHRPALTAALTAEDAIRSGNPKAFTLSSELTDRYHDIRAAHATLINAEGSGAGLAQLVHAGQVEQCLEIEPWWHALRRAAQNRPGVLDNAATAEHLQWLRSAPASPEHSTRTSIWPSGMTRTQWLLTVADTSAFVPSGNAITERFHAAERAVRAPVDTPTLADAMTARRALGSTEPAPVA
ncbi:hypothetical protein [Rhodococcus sp. H29-C3]|uniref:hypothetical protein n=1 Tax=Rhodococcus sp. H29-C3 TaxID=3046307 RepID=UPI0024BA3686|nr:hypothetical protein [Rhodococcus sp. H29-C3]MDJ0359699.1 hypothetical protein [Rhodococcus sp. H29-C3]